MKVSKKVATYGLNASMSVFVGISTYGIVKYAEAGFVVTPSAFSPGMLLLAVLIVASVIGTCYFGHQLDLRNLALHREEEARKAEEAARKGRRKPAKES